MESYAYLIHFKLEQTAHLSPLLVSSPIPASPAPSFELSAPKEHHGTLCLFIMKMKSLYQSGVKAPKNRVVYSKISDWTKVVSVSSWQRGFRVISSRKKVAHEWKRG